MRLTSIAVVVAAVATAAVVLLHGGATILATRGDVGRAQSIVVNGVTRTYTLYVPSGFQRGSGGLVIALHGSGGSGRYMARRTGLNATADRFGFAVVYPDALVSPVAGLTEWNAFFSAGMFRGQAPDDVAFIRVLIATLRESIGFNVNRLYVVGGSNGALMANRLGVELEDEVAGVGIVSGALYGFGGNTGAMPKLVGPVSVIMLHGDRDEVVPYCATVGVASQEKTFAYWAEANQCSRIEPAGPLCDGERLTEIEAKSATECAAGVAVRFYRVNGGTHNWWPGPIGNTALNDQTAKTTNDILWNFFAAHPKAYGVPKS